MDKLLFEKVICELNKTLDAEGNHLKMSALIVSQGEKQFSHYFGNREMIDVRSIAKPIVCLAFGVAIEEGLFFDNVKVTLDTKIGPLVEKYVNVSTDNLEKWNNITLRDCFKITLGHEKGIMFSKDVKENDENHLIDYVLNYQIKNKPGVDFIYSNAGTFVLSTLITEYLGLSLQEFVDKYIFTPLEITQYEWKKFGKYTAGCTGLKMFCEDLHKIAKLLLNKGNFEGKQIVSEKWIKNMSLPLNIMPTHRYKKGRAFPKLSYGMNLWICGDIDDNGVIETNGIYYCDGTDGQYIIMIPDKNIAIAATGHQTDTEPVSRILGLLK